MRLAAAFAISLGLLPSPQGATLEEVLALMEKRAQGIKDLSYKVEQKASRGWGMPVQSDISTTWVQGAGLRLHAATEPTPDMPFNFMPQSIDVIVGIDALRILMEFAPAPAAQQFPGMTMSEMPLCIQALKLRFDDPAAKNVDLQLLPQGMPIRMMIDEPLPYYMIAPRFFFGREPNLAYAGMKPLGGKSCHVLVSKPGPGAADLPRPGFWIESLSKEFYIDPGSGALLQIRWDLAAHSPAGMGGKNEKISFVTEAIGSQKATDLLSLPESVKWTVHQGARMKGQSQEMNRSIRSLKVNSGLGADAVLTDAERKDLYAEALLRPAAEYEARVAKDPKDAEAHYSLAHAKGSFDPYRMMRRAGQDDKTALPAVARALEKALEARPDSDGVVLNLLSAYKAAGEDQAQKDLLDRITKGEFKSERVRFRAAVQLNATGGYERAAKLLAALTPASEPERRRIVLEKFAAAVGSGDEAGVVALFAQEAKLRKDTAGKAALVDSFENRLQSLPEEAQKKFTSAKLVSLIDKGLKDSPDEPAYRIARASIRRADGKPVAAAIDLIEGGPGDEVLVTRAMQALFPGHNNNMFRNRVEPAPAKEWEPEEAQKLLAALTKVTIADPAVKMATGRALTIGGKAEEAQKAYAEALEACRKETSGQPRNAAALRIAFLLGMENGPDKWRETCVDVILTIGNDSTAIPYDLVYDETKSPIMALAGDYVNAKEWLKYYALACRGNAVFKNWHMVRVNNQLGKEAFAAIRAAVYKESDVAKYVEFADFLESTYGEGRNDLPEVLEKAVEKSPQDLELQTRLARTYGTSAARDKAVTAYEALIPKLADDKQVAAKVELVQLLVENQPEKARAVLGTIDPSTLTGEHVQKVIDLCQQAKDWDRGLAACKKAFELGQTPHFQTGWFHEQKENYIEALRCYNRDRAGGSGDDPEARMRREMNKGRRMKPGRAAPAPEDADPDNGEDARKKLLQKLGPDYLISRFLQQRFEPLSADQDKAVKAAVEKLASDESRERDAGFDALKKIGPRATPLLRSLLESSEPEVKGRVRQLFAEWAEPR